MKRNLAFLIILVAALATIAAVRKPENDRSALANIQSIAALSFGPDGVLFIGDSKSATVFAAITKDNKKQKAAPVEMKNIDQKIAAALGTEAANITITDMAVNPISKNLYVAVQHTDGTPVLLKITGTKIESVNYKDLEGTSVVLNDAPAADAKDGRGRSLRISSISDLGYDNGKLLVSGLSNKEFSSSFKSIPYPFTSKQDETSLEIYHASHGRFETTSPIRTFTTASVNGKKYLVASYTCTPLVLFPMEDLKPGAHVKGRTVAEMGSGNSPMDMISYSRGSESFLLMANTKYPVAKVDYKTIAAFEGTMTEPVKGTGGTAFKATPLVNVLQMDKLDENQVVMVQKKASGEIDLISADDKSF